MKLFTPENLYASYINLDHRTDRNEHMLKELNKAGIEAYRTKGILPNEYSGPEHKVSVMRKRTPGAIGCHYSQVKVMETALFQNKSALVMEDDLVFCSDIQKRFFHIDNFLNNNKWDVLWLGGTYHLNPTWHSIPHNRELPQCKCNLNRDWEPTNDIKIVRTYGCWSTYAYIVNINSLEKILKMLDDNVHLSMGIDWLFILLQPQLKTYAFNPGCVKQIDNESDIGNGKTIFSAFSGLGSHWWSDIIE